MKDTLKHKEELAIQDRPMTEQEVLKTAGNFLNATYCKADNIDGFVHAGIINTAVAEKDKITLIHYLERVREFCDKLINELKE